MILVVDMGNTHIKLGLLEGEQIVLSQRLSTDLSRTAAEYAVLINQIFQIGHIDVAQIAGAIISSVVPPVTNELREAVKMVTGKTALIVGPGMKTGLKIKLEDPKALGADLLVECVAAKELYGAPCIVIGLGTATTMFVIDREQAYIGGIVTAGVGISLAALSSGTSKLPKIDLSAPKKVINTDTVAAMQAGSVYGTAAMLDGLCEAMQQEVGYPCRVVATGGLARLIVPYCRTSIILDNDLMLKGLRLLYEKNA